MERVGCPYHRYFLKINEKKFGSLENISYFRGVLKKRKKNIKKSCCFLKSYILIYYNIQSQD